MMPDECEYCLWCQQYFFICVSVYVLILSQMNSVCCLSSYFFEDDFNNIIPSFILEVFVSIFHTQLCPMHFTCSSHFILLDFTAIFGKAHYEAPSSFCYFTPQAKIFSFSVKCIFLNIVLPCINSSNQFGPETGLLVKFCN